MSQSGKNSQGKKELEAWQESRQGEKRASQYLFVPQILHKMLASTSSYCTACAKYFPALHRTPKLANSTSKYCFMPQSLHKGDREQEGNQYYFVPQRFRRQYCPAFFYYRACAKHFRIPLRAQSAFSTALHCNACAESISQYCFVLQIQLARGGWWKLPAERNATLKSLEDPKRRFASRNWSDALHLLNSVL